MYGEKSTHRHISIEDISEGRICVFSSLTCDFSPVFLSRSLCLRLATPTTDTFSFSALSPAHSLQSVLYLFLSVTAHVFSLCMCVCVSWVDLLADKLGVFQWVEMRNNFYSISCRKTGLHSKQSV